MVDRAPPLDLQRLVLDHHAELYRYAYRLTGCQADAEDLTQQTFLQAQVHLHQVRDPQKARGWLFAILRNCYHLALRKAARLPAESLGPAIDQIPEEVDDPFELESEQLQAALNQLPDEFRVVLLLFYFEECSYREIAAQLQLPIGTVMSRLARAKQHLRAKLFPVAEEEPATSGSSIVPR